MISLATALLGEELLDTEGKARMWQAPIMSDGEPGGYAMGWELDAMRDGRQSAGHEGGMLTTFRIYPDEDLAVVFLTNGMTTPYGHDEVADMLALSFVGDIFDPADALGYQAKLAYLGDGVAGVKRVLTLGNRRSQTRIFMRLATGSRRRSPTSVTRKAPRQSST